MPPSITLAPVRSHRMSVGSPARDPSVTGSAPPCPVDCRLADGQLTDAAPEQLTSQEPADRDALILGLTRRNEQLAGQAGFLQAQLKHGQTRILELEAPNPAEKRSTTVGDNGSETGSPRRYWRFWQRPAVT
jgi:hypothetical protein